MPRSPQGPPPPAPVQRLRLRYAKRERLRFSSHRDFQRALERALRRAEVPVAFSAGFHPHPRISYAGAASTGAASEAEYVELAVVRRCEVGRVREALDAALPPGLDVVEVVEAPLTGGPALADLLEVGEWEVVLPGADPGELEAALGVLLAREHVEVERLTKAGRRTLDVRPALLRCAAVPRQDARSAAGRAAAAPGAGPCAILHLVVRHATPVVRPDDVLTALRRVADLVPPQPPQATRLAQGPLDEETGAVADPLAPGRGAVGVRP